MSLYHRVLAFDFDGTLAKNGVVPPALRAALERLYADGYILFLVTARLFGSVDLRPLKHLMSGIVWENGAVLYHSAADEVYLPFGHIARRLVDVLEAAGVPLERGKAIVATQMPHNEAVWHAVSQWGGDAVIAYNKGAVLISPPGVSKGAGLERLLELCGFSPRNLVSFGDGESDLSLLHLGELGVTVADAVPPMKEAADLVTTQPGPAGVLEALETYWLNGSARTRLRPLRHERPIPLGEDEAGAVVSVSAAELAGGNLGVFGDSGSGKSWVTGLLAEGMRRAGYQILLIDPEGDFKGMRALPGMVALEGDARTLPPPAVVVALLEKMSASIVLDLCSYPIDQRENYVAELLQGLRTLKACRFRPHWIVLEEAQYFLPPAGNSVSAALCPMLADGGWTFVSFRPDQVAGPVLAALDRCLLTRLREPAAVQAVRRWFYGVEESLVTIPRGYARLSGERLARLRSNIRRVPHVRHLHKYLDAPLPPHKRFSFRDEQTFLGVEAASLPEFLECLPNLPMESLVYHQGRGDFTAWAEDALGDGILAAQLRKLAHRALEGEALREALLQCVEAHCAELQVQR